MAKDALPILRVIGIALIVIGTGLIFWGYQLSDSIGARVTETISGAMPDEVMMRYIAGGACLAVGVFLTLRR